jgi:hypothetical protein
VSAARAERAGGGQTSGAPPVPLERGRAVGVLCGLGMFVVGFAVAGLLVVTRTSGTPVYYVSVTVGLVGVGVVGLFLNRGTVPLPGKPIWSPMGVAMLARSLGLPVRVLLAVLYGLGAVGVLGNLLVPLIRGH